MSKRPRGLGPCDLLTVEEAIRVLGMRDRDGHEFLEARGLVRHFAGRARVVAGELVQAHDDSVRASRKPRQRKRLAGIPSWDDLS